MTIMISRGKKENDTYFYVRNVSGGGITETGTFLYVLYMNKNGTFQEGNGYGGYKFKTLREAISVFRKHFPETNYYVEKEVKRWIV